MELVLADHADEMVVFDVPPVDDGVRERRAHAPRIKCRYETGHGEEYTVTFPSEPALDAEVRILQTAKDTLKFPSTQPIPCDLILRVVTESRHAGNRRDELLDGSSSRVLLVRLKLELRPPFIRCLKLFGPRLKGSLTYRMRRHCIPKPERRPHREEIVNRYQTCSSAVWCLTDSGRMRQQ
jgi:hypothetical protein